MILLGITIFIVIIGILCIIKGNHCSYWDEDKWFLSGAIILVFSGMFLIVELVFLSLKPVTYKNFKIKYDIIKETMTSKDDIRDAEFTNQLIEVNQTIRSCNEYKDSMWISIFQNKKICEMELLKKEGE